MLIPFTSASFTNVSGLAVADGAAVEVRLESNGALAALFDDREGTTPLTNPFNADSQGRFAFYVIGTLDGYSVQVTKGALAYTLHHQLTTSSASIRFEHSGIATASHRAPRTISDKLTDNEVSTRDALNSSGVQVAVDGLTDDQSGLQRVFDGSRPVVLPDGTSTVGGGFAIDNPLPAITGNSNSEIRQTGVATMSPLFYIGAATANGTPHPAYPGTVATFTGALTDTTKQVTVNSASGFAVGDDVLLLLGSDPNDPDLHYLRMWNVIQAIAGNDVTFRIPILEAVSGTFGGGLVTTHRMFKPTQIVENVEIGGFKISQGDGFTPDNSIFLIRARHMRVRDIYMPEVKSAIVIGECEDVDISNVYIRRSKYLSGSGGNGFSVYGSRNVRARGFTMLEVDHTPVYIENQCRGVTLEDFIIQCGPDKTTGAIIFIGGGSKGVVLKRFTIHKQSVGPVVALSELGDSEYSTEDFRLLGSVNQFPLKRHFGFIEYKGIRYDNIKRWSRRIALTANMVNRVFALPTGLYKRFKFRVSDKTGLTTLTLNNATTTGLTLKVGATDHLPAAGTFGDLAIDDHTTLGADYFFNEDPTGKFISINTDGTVVAGNCMDIEAEVFVAEDDGVRGESQGGVLTGSVLGWNPGAIADGAGATTTVTVTGARVGDPVVVGYSGIDNANLGTSDKVKLTGFVWANDTVKVVLINHTGGSITPASGDVRAIVYQY